MFTSALLNSLTQHMMESIRYAKYTTTDGVEHETQVEDATILSDRRLSVRFVIDPPQDGSRDVSHIALYDANDELLVSKDVNLSPADTFDGILYRFYFTIEEA